MAKETDLEKCNFRNFRSPVTLTLTLDRVIRHIVVHRSSTCIYILNFIEIGKTSCGRKDVPTDGHFRPPSNVIRSTRRVDLIMYFDILCSVLTQPRLLHVSKHNNNYTAALTTIPCVLSTRINRISPAKWITLADLVPCTVQLNDHMLLPPLNQI